MKLLLHACCAECTLKFLASIAKEQAIENNLTVYYYNPNIHPRSEYQARLKAMQKVCEEYTVKLIVPDWSPKDYFAKVKKDIRPKRCIDCWQLRLEETAKYASQNGYDQMSSTLVTSQYQNTEKVAEIGKTSAEKHGLKFFVPKNICSDLQTSGFYKQFFCGCIYSLQERFEEKYRELSS